MEQSPYFFSLLQRPFLRLTIFFVLGILSAHTGYDIYGYSTVVFFVLVCAYMVVWCWRRYRKICGLKLLTGFLGLATIYVGGYVRYLQGCPEHVPYHFVHVLEHVDSYEGAVVEVHAKSKEVVVNVRGVYVDKKWQRTQGKVKLHFFKMPNVQCGSVLTIQGRPETMRASSNPHVVNYHQRWHIQGVFHEHQPKKIKIIGHNAANTLMYYSDKAKDFFVSNIKSFFQDKEALGIGLSLLFGDRDYLENNVKDSYKKTGLMHVLAVSGLHVGLIYMLFLWFFALLGTLFHRPGHYRFASVMCLWSYVVLIGCPPSALRAVGVLSLVVLARFLQKDVDMVNMVGVLMFFMCLYNPYMLFDVGFQLSFVSFFSIIVFYPWIVSLWKPSYKYVRAWWQMTAMSLAVQVGSLPVSLYYFHFFSTYFLLANWCVLPLMPVLLGLGLGTLFLIWFPMRAMILAWCWEKSIVGITVYVRYLSFLPRAYVGPYYISSRDILLYYGILLMLYLTVYRKKFFYLVFASFLICTWSGLVIYDRVVQKSRRRIVVYDVMPHCVMGFLEGDRVTLVTDGTLHKKTGYYAYKILPSLTYWGAKSVTQYVLGKKAHAFLCNEQKGVHTMVWQGKSVVIIDKKIHFSLQKILTKVDVLIVVKDAVEDFSLSQEYTIGLLVISGGKKGNRLCKQAEKYGVLYHDVGMQGAFDMYW